MSLPRLTGVVYPAVMEQMIDKAGLKVAHSLTGFIEAEVLPGTGLAPAPSGPGSPTVFARFAPENAALLEKREALQAKIDAWHTASPGSA
jgi:malate synthase